MKTEAKNKRIHLEILRMIASIFVIFNHTEDWGFLYFTVTDSPVKYIVSIILSIMCKIAVPIFFMISGALLVEKEETIKGLYYKRIFKYVFVLVLFSAIQYAFQLHRNPSMEFDIKEFIKGVYEGEIVGPYWFFYSYLAILIMLPFIRKMVRNMTQKEFIYLIFLQIVIVGILPIIGYIGKEHYLNISLFIVSNDIFYFIMGYFFEKVINKTIYTKKNVVRGLYTGGLCIVISCIMTYYEYCLTGEYSQRFYMCLIAIPAFSIFCFWKYIGSHIVLSNRVTKILIMSGSNALGIYLIEDILRKELKGMYFFFKQYMDEFVGCCLWVILIWILGNFIITFIKKLPYIRKII